MTRVSAAQAARSASPAGNAEGTTSTTHVPLPGMSNVGAVYPGRSCNRKPPCHRLDIFGSQPANWSLRTARAASPAVSGPALRGARRRARASGQPAVRRHQPRRAARAARAVAAQRDLCRAAARRGRPARAAATRWPPSVWRPGARDGVLAADPRPAYYLSETQLRARRPALRRRDVLAALGVEPWSSGAVLPHEHTMSGPKADRLELLRATHLNASPIWVLHRDPICRARAGLGRRRDASRRRLSSPGAASGIGCGWSTTRRRVAAIAIGVRRRRAAVHRRRPPSLRDQPGVPGRGRSQPARRRGHAGRADLGRRSRPAACCPPIAC